MIRTERGTELGEILTGAPTRAGEPTALLVGRASASDHHAAEDAARARDAHFQLCLRAAAEASLPIVLLDVEPLLDPEHAVAYYLGPPDLDLETLTATLEARSGLRLVLESLGADPDAAPPPSPGEGGGCGAGCGGCSLKRPAAQSPLSSFSPTSMP